ncbi:MAG: succinate--CoA ligase subunit beta, partial [Thermoplasmata archaeon]|nr:succinate--CoA ligase subunit beta [Thermoplasmata archaeon]
IYLSVGVDRELRCPVLLASPSGGVDVEEAGDVYLHAIDPLDGPDGKAVGDLADLLNVERGLLVDVVERMYSLFTSEDAELVEINPLVIPDGGLPTALDSKIVLDDDAFFRHPGREYSPDRELTPEESEAGKEGLAMVRLDAGSGMIGVVANGAGLTMATLDMISDMGGKAGVFLDMGGTDDPLRVEKAVRLASSSGVDVVLVNIFGGMTKTDTVAEGIARALPLPEGVKLVVRLTGARRRPPEDILEPRGVSFYTGLEEAVARAVDISRQATGQAGKDGRNTGRGVGD